MTQPIKRMTSAYQRIAIIFTALDKGLKVKISYYTLQAGIDVLTGKPVIGYAASRTTYDEKLEPILSTDVLLKTMLSIDELLTLVDSMSEEEVMSICLDLALN